MLWEVYSCGSAPYPGMSNHDARSQVSIITQLQYRVLPRKNIRVNWCSNATSKKQCTFFVAICHPSMVPSVCFLIPTTLSSFGENPAIMLNITMIYLVQ